MTSPCLRVIWSYACISCRRQAQASMREALNSSCIFKVWRFAHANHFFRRSLQIGPQTSHCTFLFTRFQASSKSQRCRFIVSKRQNISIPDWHTIDMFGQMESVCATSLAHLVNVLLLWALGVCGKLFVLCLDLFSFSAPSY